MRSDRAVKILLPALTSAALDKIDRFGIRQVREGQPVQDYRNRVRGMLANGR
jgi:hypothetical protein